MSDTNNDCKVTFYKDKDKEGNSKSFTGPTTVSDLSQEDWDGTVISNDMKDDTGSVQTFGAAWVQLYSKANFEGRSTLVGPNSSVNMEDIQVDGDDMDDTIESFELYDHPPAIDINSFQDTFRAQFPGAVTGRKSNLYESEFYSEDSQYRVYDPSIQFLADKAAFSIRADHMQGESDDHATITFSMDYSGKFVDSIKVEYDIAEATQIPQWVIKLTDLAIEGSKEAAKVIADGAEIVVTDGVGVIATVETNEVIDAVADVLTFCVDHMNTVLNAVFIYQDDGGAMNFSAVVSHIIARATKAYHIELYDNVPATTLAFNKSSYLSFLGLSSWHSDDKNTRYVEFDYAGNSYRAYCPESTILYDNGGAVLSVKIDAIDTLGKDDHVILQAAFDPLGNLFSAVGSVDLFSRQHEDGYTAPASGLVMNDKDGNMIQIHQDKTITPISYADLPSAYKALLSADLQEKDAAYDLGLDTKQTNLADVSKKVLQAMMAGMK